MTTLSNAVLAGALAALCLGLAACANQKEPATQALAAIEAKLEESGAEIRKYLPERHAEVEASVASLREAMSKESYGDVVSGAAAAQDTLKRAIAEARVRRAEVLVEMEGEWNELAQSMPAMIAAMDAKITSQRGRAPKGMSGDAWKQTIAEYDAARDSWSRAAAEMTRQNFEATVLAARDAKAKISGIMDSLGVKTT